MQPNPQQMAMADLLAKGGPPPGAGGPPGMPPPGAGGPPPGGPPPDGMPPGAGGPPGGPGGGAPPMDPQSAMQLLQGLGVTPEILPMLKAAVDAVTGGGAGGPPPGGPPPMPPM